MTPAMQYFIGKIVTVFTMPINRNFTEKVLVQYFMGEVQSVDNTGVLIKQLGVQRQSYFIWSNILGIVEEEVLHPDDPEDAETIADIIRPAQGSPLESPFIDLKTLQAMSKKQKGDK